MTVAIIDNTNITNMEAAPYIWIAKKFGASIEIIRCWGKYKSTHNVPEEIIEKMRERMEVIDVDRVIF